MNYNNLTFCFVLFCCCRFDRSKSGHHAAPREAENLMKEMIERNVNPNTITYSGIINCYGKSNLPEATNRALEILEEMMTKSKDGNSNVRPNKITYNSVLDAYARKGDVDGANIVWKIMEDDFNNSGNVHAKPDVTTYNTLMNAWSKSNKDEAPKEAEKLFATMRSRYEAGDLQGLPNEVTYTSLIVCLEKSSDTEDRIQELKMSRKKLYYDAK